MQSRAILVILCAAVLLGAGAGWLGSRIHPPQYSAVAYAAVYPMPPGLQNVLTPEQAGALQSVYEAGAFQESVMAQVLDGFPGMSAQDVRDHVRIELVAYSPYTRVTATATSPTVAISLANAICDQWSLLTTQLFLDTFADVKQRLTGQAQDLDAQVTRLQSAIQVEQARAVPNASRLLAYQTELNAALQQQQALQTTMSSLQSYLMRAPGLAYTAERANADSVEAGSNTTPVFIGAAVGFAAALLFITWVARAPSRSRRPGLDEAIEQSIAEGWH